MRISEYEDPPPDSDPDKLRSFNQCSRELTRLQAEMRNFKTNVVAPEIVNKVAMTLAEISDTAEPPRQPVWPNVILRRSLFIAAAVFALAGAALLMIPPWFSSRRTKKR